MNLGEECPKCKSVKFSSIAFGNNEKICYACESTFEMRNYPDVFCEFTQSYKCKMISMLEKIELPEWLN